MLSPYPFPLDLAIYLLVISTSKAPSQQLHPDQNSLLWLPLPQATLRRNFLVGLFEMLRPGVISGNLFSLAALVPPCLFYPLSPGSCPISQSRVSFSTISSRGFGLSVQGRIPPHSKYVPLLSQVAFFGRDTRPQRQPESHSRYLQSILISSIGGTEKERGARSCHSSLHRQCRVYYAS